MDKPLVSVIIPCYNSEKYIKKAIQSVIDQDYSNIEIIVVDDCSRDETYSIVKSINSDKLKILRNKVNQGVSYSRNLGISIAKGEWIAFLDSDDYWDENKIKLQMEEALETKTDFIFCSTAYINEFDMKSSYILKVPYKISYKSLLKQNKISCSSVLIKKKLVLQYKMEDDLLHEDYYCWLRILENGKKAIGIDKPLLFYRLTSDGKSSDKFKALKMQARVYKKMKIKFLARVYYISIYSIANLKKYYKINKGFK